MEFLLVFIIGAIFGSFFNVVIDNAKENKSIIKRRSHCDHCKKLLKPFDLIPVFSYLFLGGKCRYCEKKISLYYPVVETTTALLFAFTTFTVFGNNIYIALNNVHMLFNVLYLLFIISGLIIIFFTDLKYGLIPFNIVFPLILAVFLYSYFYNYDQIFNLLFASIGVFAFFLIIFLITRGRGIGFGDVVYAIFMGLLLGFPNIIVAVYIAVLTGAFAAVILILTKQKKLHGSTIPFGPFLVLGTFACLFWGDQLTSFALNLLHIEFLIN